MQSSRFLKRPILFALIAFGLSLAGCAPESNETGFSIDLSELSSTTGALNTDDSVSIHVQVYDATPYSNGGVIFDSGCVALGRLSFRIAPMPVGDDLSVLLNVYGDESCEDLTHRAYRGDMVVTQGDDNLYTLSPVQMDVFNGFPYPSMTTMSDALSADCSTDSDCASVHPAAHCNEDEGHCMLTSLFPLNSGGPRAFHDALSLSNGHVLAVGGVNRLVSDGSVKGTPQLFEAYDPDNHLFAQPYVNKLSDSIIFSMNEVVDMGSGRFASLGGLQKFKMSRAGKGLAFEIPLDDFNINSLVHLVNTGDGTSISGTLPTPLFGAKAARISSSDTLIVGGGAAPHSEGTKVVPTGSVRKCEMDGNNLSLQCETLDSFLSVPRFGHESLCLNWLETNVCGEILFAGGYNVPKGNLADIFKTNDDGSGEVVALGSSGDNSVPGGWKMVDTGKAILAFGGTTGQLGSPADVPPYRVTIEDDEISLEALELDDNDAKRFYRTFHQVVVTGSGMVLVIGGLDAENEATSSVLRFDSEGTFIDEIEMLLPRFGHSATVISTGAHEGSVIVQGGMVLSGNSIEFPIGAEIYGDPGSNL